MPPTVSPASFDRFIVNNGCEAALKVLSDLATLRLFSRTPPVLPEGVWEKPGKEDRPVYEKLLLAERETQLFVAYGLRLLDAAEGKDSARVPAIRSLLGRLDSYSELICASALGDPSKLPNLHSAIGHSDEATASTLTIAAFAWRALAQPLLVRYVSRDGTEERAELVHPFVLDPVTFLPNAMRAARWVKDAQRAAPGLGLEGTWTTLFGDNFADRLAEIDTSWVTLAALGDAPSPPVGGFSPFPAARLGVEGEADMTTPETSEDSAEDLDEDDDVDEVDVGGPLTELEAIGMALGIDFEHLTDEAIDLLITLRSAPVPRTSDGALDSLSPPSVFFSGMAPAMLEEIVVQLGHSHAGLWNALSHDGQIALAQSIVGHYQNNVNGIIEEANALPPPMEAGELLSAVQAIELLHQTMQHQALLDAGLQQDASARKAIGLAPPCATTPTPIPSETPMPTVAQNIAASLSSEAQEAARRTGCNQFIKLSKATLASSLQRHIAPGDDSMQAKLGQFFETEMGGAILAGLLGGMLTAAPSIPGIPAAWAPAIEMIAKDLRIKAMADTGEQLAEIFMGPLRQALSFYIQDPSFVPALPAAPASGSLPQSSGQPIQAAVYREKETASVPYGG